MAIYMATPRRSAWILAFTATLLKMALFIGLQRDDAPQSSPKGKNGKLRPQGYSDGSMLACDRQCGRVRQRLVHNAVALGQSQECGELFFRRVGVEREL